MNKYQCKTGNQVTAKSLKNFGDGMMYDVEILSCELNKLFMFKFMTIYLTERFHIRLTFLSDNFKLSQMSACRVLSTYLVILQFLFFLWPN